MPSNDGHDAGTPHECPEYECELSFPKREEVRAHLEWDHNRSEAEAEAILDVA